MPTSWTDITKPAVGDPTKKQAFADKVIDDLVFLKNQVDSFFGTKEIIKNGSFENDVDLDGTPDGWDKTLYTNGTFAIETAAPIHGAKAIKFSRVLGAGNGGGYLQSTDFFECSDQRTLFFSWQHKCSAAGLKDRVEVFWFDKAKAALGTPSTTIYESTANPTVWTPQFRIVRPPANARFAKLRITGGFTDTDVAGDSFWDDVAIGQLHFERRVEFATPGTVTWTSPSSATICRITCIGGGGGGGGSSGGGGSGGGGGGQAVSIFIAAASTSYTIVVGAGGTSQAAQAGTAGGNSTFNSTTVQGNGGNGGAIDGGAAGTGGTGTGDVTYTGETGKVDGTNGGRGGHTDIGGGGGAPGNPAKKGHRGGGGGGATTSTAGGAGGDGLVIIEY